MIFLRRSFSTTWRGTSSAAQKLPAFGREVTGIWRGVDFAAYFDYRLGRTKFKRYSQKAILALKDAIQKESLDNVWKDYWASHSKKKAA
jgi:hypothetical protein